MVENKLIKYDGGQIQKVGNAIEITERLLSKYSTHSLLKTEAELKAWWGNCSDYEKALLVANYIWYNERGAGMSTDELWDYNVSTIFDLYFGCFKTYFKLDEVQIPNLNLLVNMKYLNLNTRHEQDQPEREQIESLLFLLPFSNVEILFLIQNSLSDLNGLENCKKLKALHCGYNMFTSLNGIENFRELERLDCIMNKISNLIELKNCTKLKILDCRENIITSLDGLQNCDELEELSCSRNSPNLKGHDNDRYNSIHYSIRDGYNTPESIKKFIDLNT